MRSFSFPRIVEGAKSLEESVRLIYRLVSGIDLSSSGAKQLERIKDELICELFLANEFST